MMENSSLGCRERFDFFFLEIRVAQRKRGGP